MSAIVASLQGRFGNNVMTYLFCRALAERTQSELCVEPWIGDMVFDIPTDRPNVAARVQVSATQALQWSLLPDNDKYDIEVRDYCQFQGCMIYTKRDAQRWLKLRPDVEAACQANITRPDKIVCHLRRGDYFGYQYPVLSERSYFRAMCHFGLNESEASFLSEEHPTPHEGLPDELSFVPDFYRMMNAPTLLRANSSFSWVAALLSDGLVLSPVIDGLDGGKEVDCQFVAGNHPRLAHFDFTTELRVSP